MAAVEPARERIARQLQDAVERLREDMEHVEFWTEVLGCLARPVPDYSAGKQPIGPVQPARPDDAAGASAIRRDLAPTRRRSIGRDLG